MTPNNIPPSLEELENNHVPSLDELDKPQGDFEELLKDRPTTETVTEEEVKPTPAPVESDEDRKKREAFEKLPPVTLGEDSKRAGVVASDNIVKPSPEVVESNKQVKQAVALKEANAVESIDAQLRAYNKDGNIAYMDEEEKDALKEVMRRQNKNIEVFDKAFESAFQMATDRYAKSRNNGIYNVQIEKLKAANPDKPDAVLMKEFDEQRIEQIANSSLTPKQAEIYKLIKQRESLQQFLGKDYTKSAQWNDLTNQINEKRNSPDLYSTVTGELRNKDPKDIQQEEMVAKKAETYARTYKDNVGNALVKTDLALRQLDEMLAASSSVKSDVEGKTYTYAELSSAGNLQHLFAVGENAKQVAQANKLQKERDDIYMEREALKQAYLLNKSSFYRSSDGFWGSLAGSLAKDVPGGKEWLANNSESTFAKELSKASKTSGLETNKLMDKATENFMLESIGEGTGEGLKLIPKLILAGAAVESGAEIAGLKSAQRVLLESPKIIDKLFGHLIGATEEAVKFEMAAGDATGGAGFYAGQQAFSKFDLPYAPTGFWGSALKTVANYTVRNGIGGGAAGMGGSGVANALVQSLTTNKDFQTAMDEHFGTGNDVLKTLTTDFFVGMALGLGSPKALIKEFGETRAKAKVAGWQKLATDLDSKGFAADAEQVADVVAGFEEAKAPAEEAKAPAEEKKPEEKPTEKPKPEVKTRASELEEVAHVIDQTVKKKLEDQINARYDAEEEAKQKEEKPINLINIRKDHKSLAGADKVEEHQAIPEGTFKGYEDMDFSVIKAQKDGALPEFQVVEKGTGSVLTQGDYLLEAAIRTAKEMLTRIDRQKFREKVFGLEQLNDSKFINSLPDEYTPEQKAQLLDEAAQYRKEGFVKEAEQKEKQATGKLRPGKSFETPEDFKTKREHAKKYLEGMVSEREKRAKMSRGEVVETKQYEPVSPESVDELLGTGYKKPDFVSSIPTAIKERYTDFKNKVEQIKAKYGYVPGVEIRANGETYLNNDPLALIQRWARNKHNVDSGFAFGDKERVAADEQKMNETFDLAEREVQEIWDKYMPKEETSRPITKEEIEKRREKNREEAVTLAEIATYGETAGEALEALANKVDELHTQATKEDIAKAQEQGKQGIDLTKEEQEANPTRIEARRLQKLIDYINNSHSTETMDSKVQDEIEQLAKEDEDLPNRKIRLAPKSETNGKDQEAERREEGLLSPPQSETEGEKPSTLVKVGDALIDGDKLNAIQEKITNGEKLNSKEQREREMFEEKGWKFEEPTSRKILEQENVLPPADDKTGLLAKVEQALSISSPKTKNDGKDENSQEAQGKQEKNVLTETSQKSEEGEKSSSTEYAVEIDVLGMIKASKILTPTEKQTLWRQYKRGVMNDTDVAKYTGVDVGEVQSGNINKWASVVFDKIKGKEVEAENVDFEETPTEVLDKHGIKPPADDKTAEDLAAQLTEDERIKEENLSITKAPKHTSGLAFIGSKVSDLATEYNNMEGIVSDILSEYQKSLEAFKKAKNKAGVKEMESKISALEAEVHSYVANQYEETAPEILKYAAEKGLVLENEDADAFVSDVFSEMFERPGIESNFNKTAHEVIDRLIEDNWKEEPVVPESETTPEASDVIMLPVKDIITDEARFQNRQALNEDVVNSIAENYNSAKFDPVVVWIDPSTGKTIVLSGHHRFAGVKKKGLDKVKATYFEGTEAEAIAYAKEEANANRTMETPLERASIYRKMRDAGSSKKEIADKAKDLERGNSAFIINLSHLNPDGKTVAAITALSGSQDRATQKEADRIADWVGSARRQIPSLTDRQENEMYDFLLDKDASKRFTRREDFVQKVASIVGTIGFNENSMLNLKRIQAVTQGESEYEAKRSELEEKIKEKQGQIDELNERFNNPNNKQYVKPTAPDYDNLVKLAETLKEKHKADLKALRKRMLDLVSEKGNMIGAGLNQGDLFGGGGNEIPFEIEKKVEEEFNGVTADDFAKEAESERVFREKMQEVIETKLGMMDFSADEIDAFRLLKSGRGVVVKSEKEAKKEYPNFFKNDLVYYDGFGGSIRLTEKGEKYGNETDRSSEIGKEDNGQTENDLGRDGSDRGKDTKEEVDGDKTTDVGDAGEQTSKDTEESKPTIRKLREDVKRKIVKIDEDLLNDLDDFSKLIPPGGLMLNPEQIALGVKILGKFTQKGAYKFADIVLSLVEAMGEEKTKGLLPALKAAYASFHMGADDAVSEQLSDLKEVKKFDFDTFIKESYSEEPVQEIKAVDREYPTPAIKDIVEGWRDNPTDRYLTESLMLKMNGDLNTTDRILMINKLNGKLMRREEATVIALKNAFKDYIDKNKIEPYVSTTIGKLESTSKERKVEDELGKEDVQPENTGGDGGRIGEGGERLDESGLLGLGDKQLPTDSAPVSGKGSDKELQREEPKMDKPATGGADLGGSGTDGGTGEESILERTRRLNELAEKEDARKVKLQAEAEYIPVKVLDKDNIAETLPYLFKEQHDDVFKAETRFFSPEHNTPENQYGKGMMFTNGTGTGKTYTALGIAKRFYKEGKKNILITTPNQKMISDWIRAAGKMQMEGYRLEDTKDGGEGLSITTHKNFLDNDAITKKDWDLVIYDESHALMRNQEGSTTAITRKHREVSKSPSVAMRLAKEKIAYDERLKLARGNSDSVKKLDEALQEEYMNQLNKTKVVFLSATPFSHPFNLEYVDGYLETIKEGVDYAGSQGYNSGDARDLFYIKNFGYRMRYNKLTQPDAGVDSGILERDYIDRMFQRGVMSDRALSVDHDYSRDFVLVDDELGKQIDAGIELVSRETREKKYKYLDELLRKKMDWHYLNQLTEAIKAKHSIDRIKKHLALGRKVQIFHTYNHAVPDHPFNLNDSDLIQQVANQMKADPRDIVAEIHQFEREHPEYKALTLGDLANPIETLRREFGKPAEKIGDVVTVYKSGEKGVLHPKAKVVAIGDSVAAPKSKAIKEVQAAKSGFSEADVQAFGRLMKAREEKAKMAKEFLGMNKDGENFVPDGAHADLKKIYDSIPDSVGAQLEMVGLAKKVMVGARGTKQTSTAWKIRFEDVDAVKEELMKSASKNAEVIESKTIQPAPKNSVTVEYPVRYEEEYTENGETKSRMKTETRTAVVDIDQTRQDSDQFMTFNGEVAKPLRESNVKRFNDDFAGPNILLVQIQAGKEGISLHDQTGVHQRVQIRLDLPIEPVNAIQGEGRIYRIGQKSDAPFEYMGLHTNFEKNIFGQKISKRVGTAENLSSGSKARNLKESFLSGYLGASMFDPNVEQGVGGKRTDTTFNVLTPFEKAKTYYWQRRKGRQTDKGTDYFPTPEPLGYKMVDWLGLKSNEHFLEPSAGHGAIARFAPDNVNVTAVEPEYHLSSELSLFLPEGSRKEMMNFEDFHITNKYDGIAMNPPYGHAGTTAISHLAKAAKHLKDGGRITALVPEGAFNDKFAKWFYNNKETDNLALRAIIKLPTSTFERAGTKVATQILVIDRVDNPEIRQELGPYSNIDLTRHEDINDMFDSIEDMSLPERPVVEKKEVPEGEQKGKGVAGLELVETKHTKTGEPLFTVKMNTRLSPEDYQHLAAEAKRLGGYYSSYKGGGAIPGFIFKEKAKADQFLERQKSFDLGGDGASDSRLGSKPKKKDSVFDTFDSAVSKTDASLKESADNIDEKVDDLLGGYQNAVVNPTVKSDFTVADLKNAVHLKDISTQLIKDIADWSEENSGIGEKGVDYREGKNVRTGLVQWMRKGSTMGVFFSKTGIVNVNNLHDVNTLAHELGHWMDKEVFQISGKTGKIAGQRALTTELKAFLKKEGHYKVSTVEGVAEFLRVYITDPATAAKEMPNFLYFFENLIATEPKLKKAIETARQGYVHGYAAQDPRLLVQVAMENKKEKSDLMSGIKAMVNPNNEGKIVKDGLSGLSDKLTFELLDSTVYSQVLEKAMKEVNPSLPAGDNPMARVVKLLGSAGQIDVFGHGYQKAFDAFDGGNKLLAEGHLFAKSALELYDRADEARDAISDIEANGFETSIPWQTGHNLVYDPSKSGPDMFTVNGTPVIVGAKEQKQAVKEYKQEMERLKKHIELVDEHRGVVSMPRKTLEAVVALNEADPTLGGKAKLDKLSDDVREVSTQVLDYARENGLISQEDFDTIVKMREHYVSFKRVFEDFEKSFVGSGGSSNSLGSSTTRKVVRSLNPSIDAARPIQRPMEGFLRNASDVVTMANKNAALRAHVDGLKMVDPSSVQEIPVSKLVYDKEGNLTWKSFEEVKGDPSMFQIVQVRENGKLKYYRVPKDIFETVFNYELSMPNDPLHRALSFPARVLKATAVYYNPEYAPRNIFRDTVTATMNSKYGFGQIGGIPAPYIKMLYTFPKGIFNALAYENPDNKLLNLFGDAGIYKKFLESGADQAFLVNVNHSEKIYRDFYGADGFQKVKDGWDNAKYWMKLINNYSEIGTRVSVFENAYKKTGSAELAAQEARESTADYARHGASLFMRKYTPLIPFLNPGLQHAKLLAKSAIDQPGKFMYAGAVGLTLPTLALWAINNNDEKTRKAYRALPSWRKECFWNLFILGPDRPPLSIPKGAAGILFGSSVETMLDNHFNNDALIKSVSKHEDTEALKGVASAFLQAYSPVQNLVDLTPQIIKPAVELWANKNSFTGQKIVPDRMKGLSPEEQYNDRTPEIIKAIGRNLGMSPLKMDHVLKGYTGGIGYGAFVTADYAMQKAGVVDEKNEDTFTTLSRLPITKVFTNETATGARSGYVSKFYQQLSDMEEINKTVNDKVVAGQDVEEWLGKDEYRRYLYQYYLENKKEITAFKGVLMAYRDIKGEWLKDNPDTAKMKMAEVDNSVAIVSKQMDDAFRKGEPMPDVQKVFLDLMNEQHSRKFDEKVQRERFKIGQGAGIDNLPVADKSVYEYTKLRNQKKKEIEQTAAYGGDVTQLSIDMAHLDKEISKAKKLPGEKAKWIFDNKLSGMDASSARAQINAMAEAPSGDPNHISEQVKKQLLDYYK